MGVVLKAEVLMTEQEKAEILNKLQNIIESNAELKEFTEKAKDLLKRKEQGNITDDELYKEMQELVATGKFAYDMKLALMLLIMVLK